MDNKHENEDDEEFKEDTSVINDTNESKISKDIKEEALLNRLLAVNSPLKVIHSVILYIHIYKQDIIEVENENKNIKNKDRWNYSSYAYVTIVGG